MVRRQLLFLEFVVVMVAAVCLLAFGLPPAVADDTGCSSTAAITGGCSTGSINDGGVTVGATQDVDGSGSSDSNGDGDVSISDDSGDGGATDPGVIRRNPDCVPNTACDPAAPAVHLSDLISFNPPAPTTNMEPNGWAVVGLDANFVAAAGVDVQSGTLLGAPAEVRFTPGAFSWRYGDGGTRTSAGGGASWKQLALTEFSPTDTSHIYAQTGTFTVQVSVGYSAEYRFANQVWQAIPGTLHIAAPDFSVVVGDAKTVLVGRDCSANPFGPGC